MDNTTTQIRAIAHRGLSSIFPENSMQALTAALFCSQLVEFDLMLTKDEQLIIFHDRALSRITDVQKHPQFLDRKKVETIDYYHKQKEDWWVRDFTLQEIKKLNLHQSNPKRPQLQKWHTFKIPTFEEFIKQFSKIYSESKEPHNLGGLLIEVKPQVANEFNEDDKILCEKLGEILKQYGLDKEKQIPYAKVIIQSFNIPILSFIMTSNPLIQLFDSDIIITSELLNQLKTNNVKGIGITEENLLATSKKSMKQICNQFGYHIFYWTLVDDFVDKIPLQCKTYKEAYKALKQLGVSGFITEFPHFLYHYFEIKSTNLQDIYKKLNIKEQCRKYLQSFSIAESFDNNAQKQ